MKTMIFKKRLLCLVSVLMIAFFISCSNNYTPGRASEERMKRVVKELSSDEYEGRMPGTDGEFLTLLYLEKELKELGLEYPLGRGFRRTVDIMEIQSEPLSKARFFMGDATIEMDIPNQVAINSLCPDTVVNINNSEIVFCGYGIDAPEYGWNDFEGEDLKGKTLMVFVNDPGLFRGDSALFNGDKMTYYGRWTYKYEQAYKLGAAAVLIIHDSKGAGYGFNVPQNSAISKRYIEESDVFHNFAHGWITHDDAKSLLAKRGYDIDSLRKISSYHGFKPIHLGVNFSVTLKNSITKSKSNNIIAKITGRTNPEEAVVICAHWDHFGIGKRIAGDSIYNGAVDNCTAIAWALEIARLFKERGTPERSLILLFPTLEEQGLIGSAAFVKERGYYADSILACLNTDMMVPKGRMKDITLIGYGESKLDDLYSFYAAKQDRYVMADPNPQSGLFFRSDHFPFHKAGIPSLWVYGCFDSRDKGKEWAKQEWDKYVSTIYHTPKDEYISDWDLSGIAEDAELSFEVAWRICNDLTITTLKK